MQYPCKKLLTRWFKRRKSWKRKCHSLIWSNNRRKVRKKKRKAMKRTRTRRRKIGTWISGSVKSRSWNSCRGR